MHDSTTTTWVHCLGSGVKADSDFDGKAICPECGYHPPIRIGDLVPSHIRAVEKPTPQHDDQVPTVDDLVADIDARRLHSAALQPLVFGKTQRPGDPDAVPGRLVGIHYVAVPPDTEYAVYRADQTPAGVTRQQVAETITPMQYTARIENAIDAVWALLHGEGSDEAEALCDYAFGDVWPCVLPLGHEGDHIGGEGSDGG